MEKIDEEKLLLHLESLNTSFKNKNKKDFIMTVTDLYSEESNLNSINFNIQPKNLGEKTKRSFSFDTFENINLNNFLSLKHKNEEKNTINNSNGLSSISTNFTNTIPCSTVKNSFENIISQNLIVSDELIKLILVGDKSVGKTLFINKIMQDNDNNISYIPTASLDIKRHLLNISDKYIRIELWDTNCNILNSGLIHTYFKICNGFILICDISNIDSIKFLEKQIENIIYHSSFQNIHIIANIKDGINMDEYYLNLEYLNYFIDKLSLNIRVNYFNLKEYILKNDGSFHKFINNCLLKKSLKDSSNNKKYKKRISLKKNTPTCLQSDVQLINNDKKCEKRSSDVFRDMSASPKKSKNDSCLIF